MYVLSDQYDLYCRGQSRCFSFTSGEPSCCSTLYTVNDSIPQTLSPQQKHTLFLFEYNWLEWHLHPMGLESINVLFGFGIFHGIWWLQDKVLPMSSFKDISWTKIAANLWLDHYYYRAAVKELKMQLVFLRRTFPSLTAAPLWVFGLAAFWARGLSPPSPCPHCRKI